MPLLTIPLVARRLGCAAAHVQRLAARGAFPGAKRVSGEWRIPLTAVLAFLVKPRKATSDPAAPRPVAAKEVDSPACYFRCTSQKGSLFARVCVKRQVESERQLGGREKKPDPELRRHDKKRGVAADFVGCRSEICPEGRRIRELLGDDVGETVRHGEYHDRQGQHAAEVRGRVLRPHWDHGRAGAKSNPTTGLDHRAEVDAVGSLEDCSLVTVAVGELPSGR